VPVGPGRTSIAADTRIGEFVSEINSLWPDLAGLTIADVEKADGSPWAGPLERSPAHPSVRLDSGAAVPAVSGGAPQPCVKPSRQDQRWQCRRAGRSFGRAQWVWLLL
jgi:hypothetical protein